MLSLLTCTESHEDRIRPASATKTQNRNQRTDLVEQQVPAVDGREKVLILPGGKEERAGEGSFEAASALIIADFTRHHRIKMINYPEKLNLIYKVQASDVNVAQTQPANVMERPQKSTLRPTQQEARQDVAMTTDVIHLLLTRRF